MTYADFVSGTKAMGVEQKLTHGDVVNVYISPTEDFMPGCWDRSCHGMEGGC